MADTDLRPVDAVGHPLSRADQATYLPYLLNRVTSHINLAWRAVIRPCGLTVRRWQVLSVLSLFDGSRVGSIADMSGSGQAPLSRVIDQMERDGLVERRRAGEDNRAVEVWMTPSGRQLYESLLPLAERFVSALVSSIPAGQAAVMMTTLNGMLENIDTAVNAAHAVKDEKKK